MMEDHCSSIFERKSVLRHALGLDGFLLCSANTTSIAFLGRKISLMDTESPEPTHTSGNKKELSPGFTKYIYLYTQLGFNFTVDGSGLYGTVRENQSKYSLRALKLER
ncbi:hypothetical protein CDAR_3501 [Caerostris darwini]|uniref:Uncharacterized protein n=1 Tax=Caerostris darwini TaxID=1538125 RepID=A0AAV4QXU7_9ARAC|nr:hypothetical protein CDAR_3501 [Caerostris darwini]